MDFTTRRITGIRNGFNGFESQCDAILVPTNIGDIVIINETDDNPGPSITNCAEYACPVIAVAFGLQFGKTLFVESYSHREHYLEFDCSYDLIRFHGLVSMRQAYNHTTPVPFALQPRPGWSLLPESHIQALTDAGFMLSRIIGRVSAHFVNVSMMERGPSTQKSCPTTVIRMKPIKASFCMTRSWPWKALRHHPEQSAQWQVRYDEVRTKLDSRLKWSRDS